MAHANGGKIRGTHTTLIDLASDVVRIVNPIPTVTGISLGFIQAGKGLSRGTRKVKIAKSSSGVLLTVRQSSSVQELRLFVTDCQDAMLNIARDLRNEGIAICFKKDV